MDFNSPQNMMTSLLGQTRSALIQLMEISKVSLDELYEDVNIYYTKHKDPLDQLDLLEILNYLWHNWDTIKDNLFTCDRTNAYGAPYRSYLSLIITARNDWAHNYTYSYEDVLHNCFITRKFFGSARKKVNISIVDEIIETCLQEISGRQTNIPAEPAIEVTRDSATLDNHSESSGVIETDSKGGSTGFSEISTGEKNKQEDLEQEKQSELDEQVDKIKEKDEEETRVYVTKEELREILSGVLTDFRENLVAENISADYSDEEKLDQEESSDLEEFSEKEELDNFQDVTKEEHGILVHTNTIETEDNVEREPDTVSPSELRLALQKFFASKDYRILTNSMGFKSPPTVRPGTYPHTLYLAAEGPIWGSWGPEKLKLIEEHLVDVFWFAYFGEIPNYMKGEWEGTELICIPSAEKARVQFGRNKARMLCASMDRISEWLQKYYDE